MSEGAETLRFSVRHIAALAAQAAAGCAGLGLLTWLGFELHVALTTISFMDLLVVFAMALFCGFWPASIVSVIAVASLDYFFTQPLFHFEMTDPQDWVSLMTFEASALLISRLSARELRSAKEAARHRASMEQLYELSRSSLLLDLRQPPGAQLALLMQRIFLLDAIALFDVYLGREDTAGKWGEADQGIAKRRYLEEDAANDPGTHTCSRVLLAGSSPVGALVLRGRVSPLVADALAALAAMAIDRHQSFQKEERAESAKKEEQLRSAVMDALAHDFKTPLSTVYAATAGLLEFGQLDPDQAELVAIIDQETSRMTTLCNRLLQAAKLDSTKPAVKADEINIRALIEDVVKEKANAADAERLRISVQDPALSVHADRGLLAMILGQYVDNARKYSTPGTIIEITARRSYDEALFSVHNFGTVIPMEDRERIFERFYRSPEQAGSVPGTGIGLSVARKAAAAHHGHVWVVSDRDQGTTFFLSIPIETR